MAEQPLRTPKLRLLLADQQFWRVLNKTKWNRLFKELCRDNLPIDFRRKDIEETLMPEERWDGDIFHVFGRCEVIEWLDIRARFSSRPDLHLAPVVQDFTIEVIAAARRAKVPFSLIPDGIRVWGYVRAGLDVPWAV